MQHYAEANQKVPVFRVKDQGINLSRTPVVLYVVSTSVHQLSDDSSIPHQVVVTRLQISFVMT